MGGTNKTNTNFFPLIAPLLPKGKVPHSDFYHSAQQPWLRATSDSTLENFYRSHLRSGCSNESKRHATFARAYLKVCVVTISDWHV